MPRGKRKSRGRPDPDTNLARENYPGLNQTFYRMKPDAYLRRRLTSLLLWLSSPEGLEDLLRAGIEYESLKLKWADDRGEDLKCEEADEQQRYAAIESEVLLHHASETLLRFYLAHSPKSPCPWLDLSREADFRAFKKTVANLRKRLQGDEEKDRIAFAFFGATDRKQWKPTPDESRWDAGRTNIAQFLDFYASVFLASAPYNAAKHGLALLGGSSGISVGAGQNENPFLSRNGPALQYLAIRKEAGSGLPRWAEETKWIALNRAVLMTWVACDLLKALMEIGKGRFVGDTPESVRLFDKPKFDDVIKETEPEQDGGIPGVVVEEMAMQLVYYEPSTK
jgi:hypothetical protein